MNEALPCCIIKRVVDPNLNDIAKVNQIAILDQRESFLLTVDSSASRGPNFDFGKV